MGKKINGSLIDRYLDLAQDAKDFAERLEKKYLEGINSGESEVQAIVTGVVDSGVYILVKKVGDTITLVTKTKQELDKKFGSSLTDEMIDKTASAVGDEVGILADKVYKYFTDKETENSNNIENNDEIIINETDKTITIPEAEIKYQENNNEIELNKITLDNEPYTIQNGDNLSQIAQANNTTVDKLIENNSWLTEENRISSDGSYALIKSEEKLNLTVDNKTTSYGIDDTNNFTPEYQIDLTTQDVIPLKEGQTVSDIAKLTNKSSIDLLEYNNMTLEEAKSLPVGEPIRIYKGDPETINTPEGNIKLFENYDGSETAILPEGITGEKTTINFDEDSSTLLYGDRTNPDKITYVDEVTNNYVEISKDSNGSYYKVKESNNESLLLNILFLPISSLSQKKYSSFSLLNSNILFSQSLELEKNRVSNNRFSGRDIA